MSAKVKKTFKTKLYSCAGALALVTAGFTASASAQAADTQIIEFNLPAQSLEDALKNYGVAADRQVMVATELVEGKKAPAVIGDMTPDAALDKILDGSGLAYRVTASNVVLVGDPNAKEFSEADERHGLFRVAQLDKEGAGDVSEDSDSRNGEEEERPRDQIIVTGTNIRGVAPDSSPVEVFTSSDIARTGAVTLEQFFFKLPQNLNSFTSTARFATANSEGRNSIDLRGLGVGTTLVLLNGKRLVAPGGSSPDISLIPLSAIDRVEILTDGASAVYGSDAIGGVVNVILKDRVDSVEAGVTYGAVTDGDHERFKADIIAGASWRSGNLTASYNFFDQSPLRAEDREFAQGAPSFFLLPEDVRHSALVAFEQNLGDKVRFNADILYSQRDTLSIASRNLFDSTDTSDLAQEQLFLNGGLTYEIDDNFTLDVFGTYSDFKEDSDFSRQQHSDGGISLASLTVTDVDDLEVGAKLDGALLELPAGALGFSIGAGFGEESFVKFNDTGTVDESLSRDRYYAFGEIFVPIIGPGQGISGVNRLELNGAFRFTEYSDFGSEVSPRFGVLWSPIDGVNFRGTYSEAFRAPSLQQLGSETRYGLFSPTSIGLPDLFSDTNSSVYLFVLQGPFPGIRPETSVSYTIGFDIDQTGIEGLSLSGTYFNIDYVDRVAEPDPTVGSALLLDPFSFPVSIVNPNPSAALIAELTENATGLATFNTTGVDTTDLSAIVAATTVTFDNRVQNISSSAVSGFDVGFDFARETPVGEFHAGSRMTFLFDSTIVVVEGAPVIDELNKPTQPVDFKLRSYAGYTRGGFAGQAGLNYTDSYSDPFSTPETPVSSWVTVDLSLSYGFEGGNNPGFFDNTVLSFSVQNLFDQDPPFVGLSDTANFALNEPVGFDPANASPVGRFIQFGLRKKF